MGWFDDVVDTVGDVAGDVVDTVSDTASDVVDTVTDAAGDAGGFVEDTVGAAGDWFASAATDAASWAGSAASTAGDWFASAADDYVFDTVDYVTGGAVNIDYDDGNFSANLGIDGVGTVGVSYGEDGFAANGQFDVGLASGGFGYNDDDGFSASGSAGIDWGPLPYAEGHVEVSPDGDVSVGGRAQATFPTPVGVVSGSAEGGFYRNDDGSWGASGAADGTLYMPSGTVVSGNAHVSYDEAADGDSVFNAGGGASVGVIGGPSVGGSVDYTHSDIDGVTTDSVQGEAHAEGYGLEVGAQGGYTHSEDADGNEFTQVTGGVQGSGYGVDVGASGSYTELEDADGNSVEQYAGEVHGSGYGLDGSAGGVMTTVTDAGGNVVASDSDGWANVDGFDTDTLMQVAGDALGDAGFGDAAGALGGAQDVASTVSNLAGSGDLSDVLGSMADQAGASVADVAGNLADSGNFDDFASDVVQSEVSEAAADDVWDDLG